MQEWWVRLTQIPWSVLLRHVFGWIGKDVSLVMIFWKPVDLFDKGCVKENRAVFIEGINGQERPMLEKHKLLKNNIVSFQFDLDLDLQLQNFKFRKPSGPQLPIDFLFGDSCCSRDHLRKLCLATWRNPNHQNQIPLVMFGRILSIIGLRFEYFST